MKTKINILNKAKAKANQMSFLSVLTGFLILLIMNLSGCTKDDTTTITGDLQVVPRDAAYAGCYQVVGTSQTNAGTVPATLSPLFWVKPFSDRMLSLHIQLRFTPKAATDLLLRMK